jgi:queuine/archaeosine tRNA-ribosyltransferase
MHDFMARVREAIAGSSFSAFRDDFLAGYQVTDEKVRLAQKQKWLENWETK